MTLVNSTMMALGTDAPGFSLPDTDGRVVSEADFGGRPLLALFICNHCPFVKHVAGQLKAIADDYMPKDLAVVAIMSNDVSQYPDDAPEKMRQEKAERGYPFPYLYDESQEVALTYTAACTPDVFLFDANHKLYYRGQLDETRPRRIRSGVYDFQTTPSTGRDLRHALDRLLAGQPAPEAQYPSAGCNIKWKPGNEPEYFSN
jgi:peroxiredoxin